MKSSFFLSCDTTTHQCQPETASSFLYSALVPHGSYLRSCTGILQTRENGKTYLYTTCHSTIAIFAYSMSPYYLPNKLDITECQGEIINNQGVLQCSDHPFQPRHILNGSYLESCRLSDSHYDPNTQVLHTSCPISKSKPSYFLNAHSSLSMNDAGSCIGNGKDIALIDGQLICQNAPSREVKQHTTSLYLPVGDYLTTCRNIAFYPCMGSNNTGLLTAECVGEYRLLDTAMLEDGCGSCRMSNLNYVGNIQGRLRCIPDIPFNDEDPTQGSELLPHFQCNQQ